MTKRWKSDQSYSTEDEAQSASYTPVAVPDEMPVPAPEKHKQGGRRRWLIGAGVLVILAVAAALVISRLADNAADGEAATGITELTTAPIQVRDLAETTEFTGTLLFDEAVTVSASVPGVVTAGPVEGQTLDRGSVLYVISDEVSDTELLSADQQVAAAESQLSGSSQQYSDLTEQPSVAAVASAQASVAQAELSLTNLTEPPSEATLIAAQADLSQAEEAYRDLFDGPSDLEFSNAESSVLKAQQSLEAARNSSDSAWIDLLGAQAAYCAISPLPGPGLCDTDDLPLSNADVNDLTEAIEVSLTFGQTAQVEAMQGFVNANNSYAAAQASIVAAEAALENAQEALTRLTDGPTQANKDQALAAVRAAEERLQTLWDGPSEADVMQAQANLQSAQEKLSQLTAGADLDTIQQASASVENARISLELALMAQAELTNGPTYAVLFYGNTPTWRTLRLGVDPGEDVQALEENLLALGFDADGLLVVDEVFDEGTEVAVTAWQDSLGVEATGEVEPDVLIYVSGPSQVSALVAEVGTDIIPGSPLFELTPLRAVASTIEDGVVVEADATTQRVEVQADIDDRDLLEVGTPVDIELPDGMDVPGEVVAVGAVPVIVPAQGNQAAQSYVEVTIALADPVDAIWTGADVDVEATAELAENVLTAPVTALLALVEGGYAVEVAQPDGTTKLVGVETGMFSDGFVEITGDGLSDGMSVVVPR